MQKQHNRQRFSRNVRENMLTDTLAGSDSTDSQNITHRRRSKMGQTSSNQEKHPLLMKSNLDPTIIYSFRKGQGDRSLGEFQKRKTQISEAQSTREYQWQYYLNKKEDKLQKAYNMQAGTSTDKIRPQMHLLKAKQDNFFRKTKRRNCLITTQQQFEQECNKYISQHQKEQAKELFRKINRHMQLQIKNKQGNNYYQKIRKDAIQKIDYMSYNHQYYEDQQVKHLGNVIQNCNLLIHRREDNQNKQIKAKFTSKNLANNKNRMKYSQLYKSRIQTQAAPKIKDSDYFQTQNSLFQEKEKSPQIIKMKKNHKKMQNKQNMRDKLSNIVHQCEEQQQMLKQVKDSIKIFKYFCDKLDTNFISKEARLNNYIEGDSYC